MKQYYAMTSNEVTQSEKDHMALSRKLAGECIVLLENNGVLPLAKGTAVALFGNGARQTVKGGTGSGDVNSRIVVSIEEGLEAAGFTIASKAWMDRQTIKRENEKKAYKAFVAEKSKETGIAEMLVTFYYPLKETAPELITAEDLLAAGVGTAEDADQADKQVPGDQNVGNATVGTDTAIYVISRNSGEGLDRYNAEGDYLPYPEEIENLRILGVHFKNVILVLNIGGVMELTEIRKIPGISAIVLMSQLGNIGGHVLADMLLGEVNPSGRLSDTWALGYMDYPSSANFSHNNGDVDDDNYTEGIYVGYRYFDTFGKDVLYPFGYGLSYTSFEMKMGEPSVSGTMVTVNVTVTNTGAVPGKEVVQVYYSAPAGRLHKPCKELVAFSKTELIAPGESEEVSISFDARDMASYCEKQAAWVLEKGCYVIRVGNSSANTVAAFGIQLAETVKTEICANKFPLDTDFEELVSPERETEVPEKILVLDPAAIETKTASYQTDRAVSGIDMVKNGKLAKGVTEKLTMEVNDETAKDKTFKLTMEDLKAGRCTVEELVAQLTVEELAALCVGTLRTGKNEVVGNASSFVPGAAGDSTGLLFKERGIKGLIMADGPAGLRLQPHFKTLKDGTLVRGGSILGDIIEPFDDTVNETDVVDYYQYCTAIPIGWALAQSWNMAMLEEIGSMVGSEMEQFNVDLWLAPAMNIHRNPLCGRNFEYYSEDPLLSGKAAAAITKGVQKHPGKGTCIKHFALNNQEDNRYFTNAHARERAIREIYCKGFEICVKEAQPLSLMTSYNLINGIHAANNHDLIQSLLRDEWGFEGLVMTDWYTSVDIPEITGGKDTKYPISASTGCVHAGNDIQMPGSSKNVEDLVKAVKEGKEIDGYTITLADLQYCAGNVIRVAEKCTT